MVKTTPLDINTHTFFKKTQMALLEKYKVDISMSEIMADISYALRHPEEAARIILRARHEKQEKAMNNDIESKDDKNETGQIFIKADVGKSKSEDIGKSVSVNIVKPPNITLVKKEDVNT
jgi:hypothetical protein